MELKIAKILALYSEVDILGMAIIKSAKKALRQSVKRRAGNIIYKKKMRGLLKEVRGLVSKKKIEEAKNLLPKVYKALDKAAKVGVIKKNTASRKKARITKLINSKSEARNSK